jgi:diguanylate cyclase (GGDEF)-like protein/PAS domain S-box-containing protein
MGGGPRSWSDDELVETFGRSGILLARDEQANLTALPRVLADRQPNTTKDTWSKQAGDVHPEDRVTMVRQWWRALEEPGELIRIEVRGRDRERGWRQVEVLTLNLLHQPEVRSMIVLATDLGPIEVEDPAPLDVASSTYSAPTWILQELDQNGVVLHTEGLVEDIFGDPAEELIGKNILEYLHPDDHPTALAMWVDLMESRNATRTIRQRIVRGDGSWTWIESTVINRVETHGMLLAISHDISEKRAQEAALRASQQEFRSLAEEVPAAVFRTDHRGRITFANGRWYEMVAGCGEVDRVTDLASVHERDEVSARWDEFAASNTTETLGLDFTAADDHRLFALRCTTILTEGRKPSFVGVLHDATVTVELRRQADHDALTGLLNRHAFDRALAATLEVAVADAVLCFIDLDGFKQANDLLGHATGDLILADVGERLRTCMRPQDAVARYGGDEFVVLCPDVAAAGEQAMLERIERALEPPVVWPDGEWQLRASIGVVRAEPGEDPTEVVRRADAAMYEMKRAGQDR